MFKRMTNRLWCRFGRPDNGQDLLEYALLAALIALVAFSAIAGVGTTLVACKAQGVPVVGIEIEPEYCERAVKRLRQEVLL